MHTITSRAGLQLAIERLQLDKEIAEQQLKREFHQVYENLNPVNIIKNSLNEYVSTPHLVGNILGIAAGLASGFMTDKLVVQTSGSLLRKLMGAILPVATTSLIAQRPVSLKAIGQYLMHRILPQKK